MVSFAGVVTVCFRAPPSDQDLYTHVRPLYFCRGAETFRAYPSHETNVFVARNVSPLVRQLKTCRLGLEASLDRLRAQISDDRPGELL